jgi:hypothetical protein
VQLQQAILNSIREADTSRPGLLSAPLETSKEELSLYRSITKRTSLESKLSDISGFYCHSASWFTCWVVTFKPSKVQRDDGTKIDAPN